VEGQKKSRPLLHGEPIGDLAKNRNPIFNAFGHALQSIRDTLFIELHAKKENNTSRIEKIRRSRGMTERDPAWESLKRAIKILNTKKPAFP